VIKVESGFRREYLLRLPLPLAQLYNRAYNAKSARERHDNAFYLWEATIKLAAASATAYYLDEVAHDGSLRNPILDRLLAQLALPSLGQWLGILREVSRTFAKRVDAESNPWIGQARALATSTKDKSALLSLYQRVKNGADGALATDQTVSLLGVFDALVQYRNGVFGHGAGRFESFYADEMGPLLFPALNELFAEGTWNPLGPQAAKLVYITEIRVVSAQKNLVGLRELVGLQSERREPLELPSDLVSPLVPNRVGIVWPGRTGVLRLDPLLQYRESDLSEEVLFLNRDRNGKQIEYLSYTTGRTERDRSLLPEMAQLLSRVANREIGEDDLTRLTEQSLAETPSVESLWSLPDRTPSDAGEYELLSELGRGGMGVVYLARQRSLGRLVALKMLPSDLADDEVAMARFRREIRHLARCDNPHIVKLLASGTMPDGRSYYTMEYVQGSNLEQVWRELSQSNPTLSSSTLGRQTLTAAVEIASQKHQERSDASHAKSTKETHAMGKAITTPLQAIQPKNLSPPESTSQELDSSQSMDEGTNPNIKVESVMTNHSPPPHFHLPSRENDPGGYVRRVVELVGDVAIALQSIHDQDIVHRDIKPANLMLTPDGSRIVLMDFGLAKGASHALTASRQGGLLGTLRYAAPEQLAAANIRVGPSADVRALGVTLWELLTRKRLFGEASDEAQLAHDVLSADVPRLRTIDRRFDRDLEAIVARATERRASDRISSAGRFAELLKLWLDGKSIPIRVPGVGEVLWRWAREHRAIVAMGVLATFAILSISAVAFVSVILALYRAEMALQAALQSQQTLLIDIDQELAPRAGMLEVRRLILIKASEGWEKTSSHLGHDPRIDGWKMEAHLQIGRLFEQVGRTDEQGGMKHAEEHFLKLRQIAEKVFHANSSDNLAHAYIAMADLELGKLFLSTNRLKEAIEFLERSRGDYEQVVAIEPQDIRWQRNLSLANSALGNAYKTAGDFQKAADAYRKHQAIIERIREKNPNDSQAEHDLAVSYWNLGRLNLSSGAFDDAIECFKKQVELSQSASNKDPKNIDFRSTLASGHNWLSETYFHSGQDEAALENAETAKRMFQELYHSDIGNVWRELEFGKSHYEVALTLRRLGKTDEARANCREFLRIARDALTKDPSNAEAKTSVCAALGFLGSMSNDAGDLAESRKYLEEAIQIGEELNRENPGDTDEILQLAFNLNLLGQTVSIAAESDAAHTLFSKAIGLAEQIIANDPSHRTARIRLGTTLLDAGYNQWHRGNLELALPLFQRARDLFETLVKAEPKVVSGQYNLADSQRALSYVAMEMNDFPAAEEGLTKVESASKQLSLQQPNNLKLRQWIGNVENNFGELRLKQGNVVEAKTHFNEALEIFQRLADEHPNEIENMLGLSKSLRWLGQTDLNNRQFPEALEHFTEALDRLRNLVRENRENPHIQYNLSQVLQWVGICYFEMKEFEKAREGTREWLETMKGLAEADPANNRFKNDLSRCYRHLAQVSDALQDDTAAITARTAALKIDPGLAMEWDARGNNYVGIGDETKAIADFTQAITLKPDTASYYFDRAVAYRKFNKPTEALNDLEQAIKLAPDTEAYWKKREEWRDELPTKR
jgi:serine/threonine protein kinase/tetratricopeptide (TPR) repeat protein